MKLEWSKGNAYPIGGWHLGYGEGYVAGIRAETAEGFEAFDWRSNGADKEESYGFFKTLEEAKVVAELIFRIEGGRV
jgi:hypothetical protein